MLILAVLILRKGQKSTTRNLTRLVVSQADGLSFLSLWMFIKQIGLLRFTNYNLKNAVFFRLSVATIQMVMGLGRKLD